MHGLYLIPGVPLNYSHSFSWIRFSGRVFWLIYILKHIRSSSFLWAGRQANSGNTREAWVTSVPALSSWLWGGPDRPRTLVWESLKAGLAISVMGLSPGSPFGGMAPPLVCRSQEAATQSKGLSSCRPPEWCSFRFCFPQQYREVPGCATETVQQLASLGMPDWCLISLHSSLEDSDFCTHPENLQEIYGGASSKRCLRSSQEMDTEV